MKAGVYYNVVRETCCEIRLVEANTFNFFVYSEGSSSRVGKVTKKFLKKAEKNLIYLGVF